MKHDNVIPADSAAPSGDALATLVDCVGVINRVQSALRSTLNVDDIYSIILSTLISREGFGYSRAMLLGYDPAAGALTGISALGALDAAQHLKLDHDIHMENKTLAHMVRGLNGMKTSTVEEETIFKRSLRDLSHHSFWITTFQIYSAAPQLQDALRRVEIPCPDPGADNAPTGHILLDEVLGGAHALIVPPERLREEGFPDELIDLLPGESLWMAIHTQKGLRLVVIADRLFNDPPRPLQPLDVFQMDWIAGQAAMGLEVAEAHRNVEHALRALQDLDHLKTNFLATISHELRTPLTAINGYVQLLLGNKVGSLSQAQRDVLARVIEHSELLTGKVNDLIEIAELNTEEGDDLQCEPIDPLAALVAIMPRVDPRRLRKRMTIDPAVEEAIPTIASNSRALERIFFHLIDNALKFGREGGVVRVRFLPRPGELAIAVQDDGIGISQHQLQKIFDAFYQIDNQLTRKYDGLGIGLTLVKRQLELTGGRIEVQSDPDNGSTFTIIYPLV